MKFKLHKYFYYKKLKDIQLSIYSKKHKNRENPLGYCFNISPKDKSVYIIGKYHYFNDKEFNKLIKSLKEVIIFHENFVKNKDEVEN